MEQLELSLLRQPVTGLLGLREIMPLVVEAHSCLSCTPTPEILRIQCLAKPLHLWGHTLFCCRVWAGGRLNPPHPKPHMPHDKPYIPCKP